MPNQTMIDPSKLDLRKERTKDDRGVFGRQRGIPLTKVSSQKKKIRPNRKKNQKDVWEEWRSSHPDTTFFCVGNITETSLTLGYVACLEFLCCIAEDDSGPGE